MTRLVLYVLLACMVFTPVLAEIPYVMRDGIEEVDYEKLTPIPGFKLPDSGQFRETTFVHGEDADYTRHPMSFTHSEDGLVVIDNNTGLMWERHINWRWGKTVQEDGHKAGLCAFDRPATG